MSKPFGLSVALTTPFKADGALDLALLADHAAACLKRGADGVTLFGTTGEGASIGAAERAAALDALIGAGVAAGSIVAGVLVNAVDDAIAQARDALRRGAKAILLAPPSYFKGVSDDGVHAWFAAVIDGLGEDARDILLYNIPSVTAVKVSLDVIGRLHGAFPKAISGVKDSGGNWDYTEALTRRYADKLAVLVGDERHLAAAARIGAQGAISGIGNVLPDAVHGLIQGRDNAQLLALVETVLRYPVTPAVKALVAIASGDDRWLTVRPPLVSLAFEARDDLALALRPLLPS
ncbi:MAG: dihydrodipicolinate synthase family protein [Pelagibacterium sp. SCN 64-44]|nr:MAG: dihydrodipicolinate synthase family protein [Pelagibacterium sp. SCN 64-44]